MAALLVLPLAYAPSGAAVGQQQLTKVSIGVHTSLTEPFEDYGFAASEAVKLAAADFTGFEVDGVTYDIELVILDDEGDPSVAETVAQQLVDAGIVGVIGPLTSGCAESALPVYEAAGIPVISGSATTPDLAGTFDNFFRTVPHGGLQAEALAAWAGEFGFSAVAVVDDGGHYSISLADPVEDALDAEGVDVLRRTCAEGDEDFSAQVSDIEAFISEAVIFTGSYVEAGLLREQLLDAGLGDVRFMGGDAIKSDEIADAAGGAANAVGMLCTHSGLAAEHMPGYADFADRFEAETSVQPGPHAESNYDALGALVEAIVDAQSLGGAEIIGALFDVEYHGVMGLLGFDEHGELTVSGYAGPDLISRFRFDGHSWVPFGDPAVFGTITDAATGEPIAGAEVWVGSDGSWSHMETSEDGRYSFDFPAGEYTVFVWCDRYANVLEPNIVFDGENAVDFALEKALAFYGIVTDAETGLPIEGAWVEALDFGIGEKLDWTTTWEDGSYELHGPIEGFSWTGEYSVYASAEGYRYGSAEDIVFDGENPVEVDFALERASAIFGTITDAATGEPIEGAMVTCLSWPHGPGGPEHLGEVIVGDDGEYEIFVYGDVSDRDLVLYVQADGYANATSDVPFEDETIEWDIELEPGELSVYGVITDAESGEPVSDSSVWLEFSGPGETKVVWLGHTDEDAEYRIYGLEPGTEFSIRAHGLVDDEWFSSAEEVHTFTGPEALRVDLAVSRQWHPHFNVEPFENIIWGHEWPAHAELAVSIEGSAGSAEYSVDANEWGDFDLWDLEGYDVQPGDSVTVTDGVTSKSHVVTVLTVTEVDAENNVVRGTAEPGSAVWVHAEDWEGYSYREVPADDLTGEWEADFSVAGGPRWQEQPFDIEPGTWGNASQRDADGDATFAYWHVPSPHFRVNAQHDYVWGHEWLPDAQLTITIDDGHEEHVFSADADEWGDFERSLDGSFDIQVGHSITVTDGTTVKTHVVAAIEVTEINLVDAPVDPNTVKGTTDVPAGSVIQVELHAHDTWRMRYAEVQPDGTWVADFGQSVGDEHEWQQAYDLVPGIGGVLEYHDEESDVTHVDWRAANPHFYVNQYHNSVWGHEWAEDTEVTVTVGDVNDPVFSDTAMVDEEGDFHVDIDTYDIVTGDLVTVTGSTTTKAHVVTPLAITDVDPVGNTISGVALPNGWVDVGPHLEWPHPVRWVQADEDGHWVADFSSAVGPHPEDAALDIGFGMDGWANERDEEGDGTHVNWHVADVYLYVAPDSLDFTAEEGSTDPITVGLTVHVLADENWTDEVDWSAASGADWISVDPESGAVDLNDSFGVDVAVDPSGLGIDDHDDAVTISVELGSEADGADMGATEDGGQVFEVVVPVTLAIEAAVAPDPLPGVVAGPDRYRTAIEGSRGAFDSADAVVIATGEHFADALGGAALAGAVDGPLLLTPRAALPSAVAGEVRRLEATTVYVLGGTAAVSADVANALRALPRVTTVTRIQGSDRYQTADRVAAETIRQLNANGGYSGDAFVATGANFPDALGASPIAASQGMPVFLANPARTSVSLHPSVQRVWITGGSAVVSPQIQASLGNRFAGRLWGADRFATAAAVARFGVQQRGMTWNEVGITTGMNFPDALAAGPVLGSRDAVMLLTDTNAVPAPTRNTLSTNRAAIDKVTFFGGDAAVPPGVRRTVNNLID